ncbi:helix-turn-helix transcriptional regulator [Candidatus Saccharibacteria bacterium]|nr:helix-turn-helix transcriptional regulator [Candidatus Saccharibacteria bacterium]
MARTTETIGCVKAATRVLGDKWTPQLLRFLINEESVRFCQIQDLVEGINPRTLSARLVNLEHEGIIEKVSNGDSSRCEYRLTTKGRDLAPILHDMDRWSAVHSAA